MEMFIFFGWLTRYNSLKTYTDAHPLNSSNHVLTSILNKQEVLDKQHCFTETEQMIDYTDFHKKHNEKPPSPVFCVCMIRGSFAVSL